MLKSANLLSILGVFNQYFFKYHFPLLLWLWWQLSDLIFPQVTKVLFIFFFSLFALCFSDWINSILLSSSSLILSCHLHSTIEPTQQIFHLLLYVSVLLLLFGYFYNFYFFAEIYFFFICFRKIYNLSLSIFMMATSKSLSYNSDTRFVSRLASIVFSNSSCAILGFHLMGNFHLS